MKICFVLENFFPHIGGLETEFSEFIKRLREKGHEVRVVTSASAGLLGEREYFGAKIFYLKSLSVYGHPLLPGWKIKSHVAWSDIVHTVNYTAAPIALRLAERFQKPCLITVHEALREKWLLVEKNPVKAVAFWLFEWYVITRKYDAWHVISRATRTDLLKYHIDPGRVVLIYLGVDPVAWNSRIPALDIHGYLGLEKRDKIFLFSGRPGKLKGMFVLARAVEKLRNALPGGFKFGFLLSDDPQAEKRKLLKFVKKSGLQDLIRIKDTVTYHQLSGYKKACFACIVPSLHEGFGFNAVETCRLGVPIIVSDTGPLPEVVSGKVLFFRCNDVLDLADKIMRATRDEFEDIEPKEFSWDASVEELVGAYEKLIGQWGQSP
jgi:glycosyltransferase involved in cell wall biosynthesis